MKKRTTTSKPAKSVRTLPTKAVRRKTADGIRGGAAKPHSDEGPTEDITFVYGKLGVKYTPQR
jgi:hypothetical protein